MAKTQFRLALALTLGLTASGNVLGQSVPGLWDGAGNTPPQSIHTPDQKVNQGSFRYAPMHPVYFESDKAVLTRQGQQALDAAISYIKKHNDIKRILVEGHTDEVGNIHYNDRLSDRRADIVRNYLTIQGVDPNLIVTLGKGEHAPVDQNWTREGRQRNRHVSIYAVHWQQ